MLGHNIPCLSKSRHSLLPREPQGSCFTSTSPVLSTSTCHEPGCNCSFFRIMRKQACLFGLYSPCWSNKKRLSVHKPCLTGKIHSSHVAFLAEGSWLRRSLPGLIRHRLTVVRSKFRTHLYKKRRCLIVATESSSAEHRTHITKHSGWKSALAQESCTLSEFCFTHR